VTSRAAPVKSIPPLKTRFIVNPRSGHAAHALEPLQAFARRSGAGFAFTERPHHATELATAAVTEGCALVVAVGGDGTMNEVARALVDTPAALGLVPLGSGNGLARHLRIPLQPPAAVALLEHGRIRPIDAGLAGDRLFFCAAGCGFDAAVLARFNRLPRRGFASYLLAAAREFLHYTPEPLTIRVDDEPPISLRPLVVAVANAAQYGNGALIAPRAEIDDGQLDLVAIPAANPYVSARLLWRLFHGTLDRDPRVRIWRARRFEVARAQPGPMHVDGELIAGAGQIFFGLRPARLRVLVPA
jgi:diacylglycerol kinase (ATP)